MKSMKRRWRKHARPQLRKEFPASPSETCSLKMSGGIAKTVFAVPGWSHSSPCGGENTHALIREMLQSGLRARIVCVDPSKLSADFVGQDLDDDLLRRMPAGADPSGENGEFHTF